MKMKQLFIVAVSALFGMALVFHAAQGQAASDAKMRISKEAQVCMGCHEAQSPSFVKEWQLSRHAEKGVDCYSCHKAEKSDPDAMDHNGFTIRIIVTPKNCGKCHAKEERR